jgi:hypothetical protein
LKPSFKEIENICETCSIGFVVQTLKTLSVPFSGYPISKQNFILSKTLLRNVLIAPCAVATSKILKCYLAF